MIPAQTDYYFFLINNDKQDEAAAYKVRCATPNPYDQYYIAISKGGFPAPVYWSLSPYRGDPVVAEFEDRIGPSKRDKYYSPVKYFIRALSSASVQEYIALAISDWTPEQQFKVKKSLDEWLKSDESV